MPKPIRKNDCDCPCHELSMGVPAQHIAVCCNSQSKQMAEDNEVQMLENLASEDLPKELDD